jgi:hypothetical protein
MNILQQRIFSPDLANGSILCAVLKNTLYSNHAHTLEELQIGIYYAVETISTETSQTVSRSISRCVHVYEEYNGHFQFQ